MTRGDQHPCHLDEQLMQGTFPVDVQDFCAREGFPKETGLSTARATQHEQGLALLKRQHHTVLLAGSAGQREVGVRQSRIRVDPPFAGIRPKTYSRCAIGVIGRGKSGGLANSTAQTGRILRKVERRKPGGFRF